MSITGTDKRGRTNWTPQFGEWDGYTLRGTGYVGTNSKSFYQVRDKLCTAHAVIEAPGTWGVTTPLLAEWWMSLPVTPKNIATYRIIGHMDHTTYQNRGIQCLVELTFQVATPHVKFLITKNTTSPFSSLEILSGSNWSTYVSQFFGSYGAIVVNIEYEVN